MIFTTITLEIISLKHPELVITGWNTLIGIIFDGVSTTSPGTQVFMSVVKDPFSGGANAVVARNAVSCSELNSTFPIHYINGTHILHASEGDRFWLEANRTGLTGTVQVANSTFSHFAFSAL